MNNPRKKNEVSAMITDILSSKSKTISIIVAITVIIVVLASITLLSTKSRPVEQASQTLRTYGFNSKYKTFEVGPEALAQEIRKGLETSGIEVSDIVKNPSGSKGYVYDYQYGVELADGDVILVQGREADNTEMIRYYISDKNNLDTVRAISKTLSAIFNVDKSIEEIEKDLEDNFYNAEPEGGYINYVNNHISYHSTPSSRYFAWSPSEYETNNEYKQAMKELDEWLEKYKREQTEAEKRKQAQAEADAKAEAEYIASKTQTFTAGKYTVGVDIPAGTYNMIAISGRGNCFVEYKVIETFASKPDDYSIVEYKNVKLELADEIEVSGSLKIKFEAIR